MDTLAGRYGVPPVGPPRDFHPLVVRPAGRTEKKTVESIGLEESNGGVNL